MYCEWKKDDNKRSSRTFNGEYEAKLNTGEGTEQYQRRMSTVEPAFGQMKQDRGFREFLLRGKRKTGIEFVMMCTVQNIKKIADFIKKEMKNLKEMLKMIAGGGSKGWNKGINRARIANRLC
ncbi:MAG: transposase [Euryarchaeota archaeon]|nr:transposase [Euryarchaeota archaeon]